MGLNRLARRYNKWIKLYNRMLQMRRGNGGSQDELSSRAQGLNGPVDKIASEVNMGDDGNGSVGKKPMHQKREREHSEEGFVPLKKKSSPIHKRRLML